MPAPKNTFKQALRDSKPQIGLWIALANAYTAEICGGAGFDWLVIDGEHGPNDLPLLSAQLQGLAASPSHPVVRVPIGEAWLVKQVLDVGFQTVLVPMIETAEQAHAMVRAMRYPPDGMRGVGAGLARASRFNRIPDYLASANEEVCLLLQIESRAGIEALDDIAAIDGVDGVFIGPSDLAADMGYLGKPAAPDVNAVIETGIERILSHGKAAGVLTGDKSLARRYLELGATFVAVGTDVGLLVSGSASLAADFKRSKAHSPDGSYG
ncbi:4-hydroxy-2-oxoheptanedioate aldolase [Martelella soudanensis]|uniref:4-hydroxy-2-oxoheptanedioate aldolase n=1 Tax=unclassified Martelella TaxID=2629616 RepID=UPI0015DD8F0F|nr:MULTISPECIES: 4-hydroxy-2-oxoheptanedioate aldolase [unclassified Martelella]